MEEYPKTSVLTDTQREKLLDEEASFTHPDRVNNRIRRALVDFHLLNEFWENDDVAGVFEDLEEDVAQVGDRTIDISPQECVSAIITLAYIGLNHLTEKEIKSNIRTFPAEPRSPDRDFEPADLDRLMGFRCSLSRGLEKGISHFREPPSRVLVDANTPLYEFPPESELSDKLDTEVWQDWVRRYSEIFDLSDAPSAKYEGQKDLGKADIINHLRTDIDSIVEEYLKARRDITEENIIRHSGVWED